MLGRLALVLHAHLPYVRHPEHERSLEERWLHEALWESYLPLLDVLDRLEKDGVAATLTLSVSPPLAAMLRDRLLKARFVAHLDRLARLAEKLEKVVAAELLPALRFYQGRLAEVAAVWDRVGGDVLGAFKKHAAKGRLELWTTSATHAYLPGLAAAPASIRAQIRLGLRAFASVFGEEPKGFWLPECAYEPGFGDDLAEAGVACTIVDGHGLLLASPRPPRGVLEPIVASNGVAFFGRDAGASHDVWSRKGGFPGHPSYREFYRDVGFDLAEEELDGDVGPGGTRVMTGLKLHRITGPGLEKEPYDPGAAIAQAKEHARLFVEARGATLREGGGGLVVAPFDAELFGHWWLEGPAFLEEVLRLVDARRDPSVRATTPAAFLAEGPELSVAEPAASSWGEGGFGAAWTGPEAARLWRHVHHAEELVRAAVEDHQGTRGLSGRALDQAIRELLLLQSSDWAFMLRRGEMGEYAAHRAKSHATRVARLVAVARTAAPTLDDLAWVHAVKDQDRFLAELEGARLRDAFDPW